MQSVTFALPTQPAAGMSKDEQGALVVNQATAVIIAAWLEYLATVSTVSTVAQSSVNLANDINRVQNALKKF